MRAESERDKRATDGLAIRNAEGLGLRHVAVDWDAPAPEARWAHGLALRTVRDFRIAQFDNRPAPLNPHAAVLLADTRRGSLVWPALPPAGPVYCQVTGRQTRDLRIQAANPKKLPQLAMEPAAEKAVTITP